LSRYCLFFPPLNIRQTKIYIDPKYLWLEKGIKSVANVARNDINDILELAAEIPIIPDIEGKIRGAKVLRI
jgi:propanol-preferring alcohol dehydrogenase